MEGESSKDKLLVQGNSARVAQLRHAYVLDRESRQSYQGIFPPDFLLANECCTLDWGDIHIINLRRLSPAFPLPLSLKMKNIPATFTRFPPNKLFTSCCQFRLPNSLPLDLTCQVKRSKSRKLLSSGSAIAILLVMYNVSQCKAVQCRLSTTLDTGSEGHKEVNLAAGFSSILTSSYEL